MKSGRNMVGHIFFVLLRNGWVKKLKSVMSKMLVFTKLLFACTVINPLTAKSK